MELIAKERDRLLQRCARAIGLASTLLAFLCLSISGILGPSTLLALVPFFALLVLAYCRLTTRWLPLWISLAAISGLAILVIVQLPHAVTSTDGFSTALLPVAAGSLAALSPVLIGGPVRLGILGCLFVATLAFTTGALSNVPDRIPHVIGITMCWAILIVFSFFVSESVPRAARRIYSIGRAHRAERTASELEAQRRQGARLLHDTVLATLTLLAHSGVGVAPSALQHQAGEDARLLRQLRLGATPVPHSSGSYALEQVADAPLGTTLESVKQRFGRMGLEVSWHGTGQVLLPSEVLDAFLLALAECLENVRRHAGVSDAHVTITTDESTVRAMVTDSGIGFNIADIDDARLGFKESVVARLRDVGGNARLFSSPGAGTTVVLEVPR